MSKIIEDIAGLVIGHRYVVETGEPRGVFHVGAFVGWRISIAPDGCDVEPEMFTSLPGDWDGRYPTCIFESAEVEDHYMFEGWEE
jgi:hypothetical protein